MFLQIGLIWACTDPTICHLQVLCWDVCFVYPEKLILRFIVGKCDVISMFENKMHENQIWYHLII